MPDSSEEKTEKPTAKKRNDQRKEGNIFQSKEIVIAASLLVTFTAFKFLYNYTESAMKDCLKWFFGLAGSMDLIKEDDGPQMFIRALMAFAIGTVPILLIASLVAVIATIVQTKGLVNFKSLKPKFGKLNPLKGIKNMVSLKGLIELLKSIIKIVILFYIIYISLEDEISTLPKMIDMPFEKCVPAIGGMLWSMSIKVMIAFAFVAGADYMYQRWSYEKSLRMTKQEIKEEYKMTEGDPKIKGQIKQKQQAMSRQRMMQNVPGADVVIRNPTHYAVALKYNAESNHAPVIVAKGEDLIALKIIEVAEKNNVPVMENKPLARALFAEVPLDTEIPSEFYNPVAEVLAYVYSLREKELN